MLTSGDGAAVADKSFDDEAAAVANLDVAVRFVPDILQKSKLRKEGGGGSKEERRATSVLVPHISLPSG